MNEKETKGVLTEYLRKPQSEYAVMLEGAWGSGKTYFLLHTLPDIMKDDVVRQKRKHYAYISLYGINSIDSISKEIIFQLFGKKHQSKIEIADNIMNTATNIITTSLGAFSIDLSKFKKLFSKINIRDWVICFDDLERCMLPINEILGFINNLVENNKYS